MNLFNNRNAEEITQLYLTSDVFSVCLFEKFINVSINEFRINPLFCVSLPGYTWQCRLNYTGKNLQTLQDKDLILTIKNRIRGGTGSVVADRFVKSNDNKKILYFDAENLCDWAMSESLLHDKTKFDKNIKVEEILKTPDDDDFDFFAEI